MLANSVILLLNHQDFFFFLDCSKAREVWEGSKLFKPGLSLQFRNFMDLMWYVVMEAQFKEDQLVHVIMIPWAL